MLRFSNVRGVTFAQKIKEAMVMKRKIIHLDEALCNGCGLCVEGCHEGALQLIEGKARLVSELYCDGLGACLKDCPVGAITIEEREAEPYDEVAVMKRMIPKGGTTIAAHLAHLKAHGEVRYLEQGLHYLKQQGVAVGEEQTEPEGREASPVKLACGCPGTHARSFNRVSGSSDRIPQGAAVSELTHWPVQLHLLNPQASYFEQADLVLAADCTAFAYPNFHATLLKHRKLAIACPKLDREKESYVDKLVDLIDRARINTLTVVMMEVPCCSGLLQLARLALEKSARQIPIKKVIIGVQGEWKEESWVF